jgi:hypothetical protein
MSDVLRELERIASEAAQLAREVEAEGSPSPTPTPTQYSTSVTSCVTAPDTGVISLSVDLYPGEQPITPAPEGQQPAVEALPPDEGNTAGSPPGQEPAIG